MWTLRVAVLAVTISVVYSVIYTTPCSAGCRPANVFPNTSAPFCFDYLDKRDNICYDPATVATLDAEISALYDSTYKYDVTGGKAKEKNTPDLYDINGCTKAAKRFLCAHYFPRCTGSSTNGTALGICQSLCENYYIYCNSIDLVSFRCGADARDQWNSSFPTGLYSGSYPNDLCTGDASQQFLSWPLRMLVALIMAAVLLL
jgi:hypothetical protein